MIKRKNDRWVVISKYKWITKEKKQFRYADFFYICIIALIGVGIYSKISQAIDYAATPIDVNAIEGFISPLPKLSPVTYKVTPSPTPTAIPTPRPTLFAVRVIEDSRSVRLEEFLKSKNSPLAPYAGLIVAEADEHDIGWTKIIAISAMESSYGKNIKPNSYNAWGIGGKNYRYFTSWEEGIKYVSALLGKHYKANEFKAIQIKYCPSFECNPEWVNNVLLVSNQILDY